MKKDIILRAAHDCFEQFGFDKTTMSDIGRAVGLNKASLYYYYKNKESLFVEVLKLEKQQYFSDINIKIENTPDLIDKIVLYAIEQVRHNETATNIYKLTPESNTRLMPLYVEAFKDQISTAKVFAENAIKEGIKNNYFKECNTRDIAEVIITSTRAFKQMPNFADSLSEHYKEVERVLENTLRLILNGIKK